MWLRALPTAAGWADEVRLPRQLIASRDLEVAPLPT